MRRRQDASHDLDQELHEGEESSLRMTGMILQDEWILKIIHIIILKYVMLVNWTLDNIHFYLLTIDGASCGCYEK